MGTFLIYIIKTAICLIVFYLFYRLLLSKDTFHRHNRIALLCLMILSFVLPFVKINFSASSELNQPIVDAENFFLQAETINEVQTIKAETTPNSARIGVLLLLLTYLAGMVFYASRQIWSLFRMRMLFRCSRTFRQEKEFILLVHDKQIAPFSWMKYILISKSDLEENGNVIISHELAHIRRKHSWDLYLADLCILFQWFNPAAWLLKQELQSIHEFEADEMVINQGIDAKQYQLLIIKKAVGSRLYSMANSFNHSSLKKRITMMLKEKSNPRAALKYLYVLPLTCITLLAFAHPEVSSLEVQAVDKINEVSGLNNQQVDKNVENPLLSSIGEILAVEDGAQTKQLAEEKTNSTAEVESVNLKIKGKVFRSTDEKALTSVSIVEVDPTGKAVGMTISKDDGTFELEAKNKNNTLRFSCIGYKNASYPINNSMSVRMEEETLQINETVVVGYPVTLDKKDVKEPNGKPVTYMVEQMPQFPGGNKALMEYIRNNVRYPSKAAMKAVEGRVICSCVIDAEGKVTEVKILASVDEDLDNEAKRVVENMPDWIPGKQNGKDVPVRYAVPISFKLNK
ncbi:MAG TPA: TonB family protein [Bacteroidales bacterium]|nr:TonB family protein [Bacteroidales bacterium]